MNSNLKSAQKRTKNPLQIHPMKVDTNAHDIINRVRGAIMERGIANPNTSAVIRELYQDSNTLKSVVNELLLLVGEHGENEGVVELVRRLVRERDDAMRKLSGEKA